MDAILLFFMFIGATVILWTLFQPEFRMAASMAWLKFRSEWWQKDQDIIEQSVTEFWDIAVAMDTCDDPYIIQSYWVDIAYFANKYENKIPSERLFECIAKLRQIQSKRRNELDKKSFHHNQN